MQNGEGLAAAASAAVSKKAKAQVKRDLKRAIKPAAKPVKEALHKARKWTDKTFHKVPILGNLASLPIDVADDLAQDILPEIKSTRKKWIKPEFVDKLPQAITAAEMAVEKNPGPGKKRNSPKKRAHKAANKARRVGKKQAAHDRAIISKLKRVGGPTKRRVRYRNKKTGKSQSGMKMKSSEYLWETTISSSAAEGDEVISGGLPINPHQLLLAELAIEVKRWEMYRIRPRIQMETISNGVVDCELFGYYDPDPTDRIPTTAVARMQVAETHGGKPGYVSEGMTWIPNSKRMRATAVKWFYCDAGGGASSADTRLETQYRFRLLVKRPPAVYTTTTGASPVPLKINLRIMYDIDFRNRTIDIPESATVVNGTMMAVQSLSPLFTTTAYTGIGASTAPSNYTLSSTFNNTIQYFVHNSGAVDRLYRSNLNGRKCHKYVLVSYYAAASTLTTGTGALTLTNLTSVSTSRAVTGSNEHLCRHLFSVDDPNFSTQVTPGGTSTRLTQTQVEVATWTFHYGWIIQFNNFGSVTTPSACSLQVTEFEEGEQLQRLLWHGPATVEYDAVKLWKEMDDHKRPPFQEYLKKYMTRITDRVDELAYWKSKAQGKEIEAREQKYHKAGLSLTPTPSDDEEDWLAYQQQKAAMYKSPGIIGMKPLKIVQDDEKSDRGSSRPKASSQK